MRDSQKIRMLWIDAFVRNFGKFGSNEKIIYQQKFLLNKSQSSRDQDRYIELFKDYPGFIKKLNGSILLLSASAAPELEGSIEITDWLDANLQSSYLEQKRAQSNEPSFLIANVFIKAIKNKNVIVSKYHSRSNTSEKIISPHAIVNVSGRVHARAYDHDKNRFADFVLARFEDPMISNDKCYIPANKSGNVDREWFDKSTIEIRANPNLYNVGIQSEFSLDDDFKKTMLIKKAIAMYIVDDKIESSIFVSEI